MSIIRNLTISNIALDDLGGITIQASSDYDLKEEDQNDIANSGDLNNNITAGNIVFVDNQGNQLTQQESLDTQNNISAVFSTVSLQKLNTNIAGTPFSTINFKDNLTPGTGGISVTPNNNLSKTIIGGQEMLTYTDPIRANKILSIERIPFFYYNVSVSVGTFLRVIPGGASSLIGYIMPFDATIVAYAAITLLTASKTAGFVISVDDVVDTNFSYTIPGTSSVISQWDNFSDFDINAGQKITLSCNSLTGGGNQNGVSIMLYIRWRG